MDHLESKISTFNLKHYVPFSLVFRDIDTGIHFRLEPAEDLTPLESLKISYLIAYSNITATQSTYLGHPDYISFIKEHKLERHFKII